MHRSRESGFWIEFELATTTSANFVLFSFISEKTSSPKSDVIIDNTKRWYFRHSIRIDDIFSIKKKSSVYKKLVIGKKCSFAVWWILSMKCWYFINNFDFEPFFFSYLWLKHIFVWLKFFSRIIFFFYMRVNDFPNEIFKFNNKQINWILHKVVYRYILFSNSSWQSTTICAEESSDECQMLGVCISHCPSVSFFLFWKRYFVYLNNSLQNASDNTYTCSQTQIIIIFVF